jgi:anti-sigma factor (TIGR02949 family)
MDKKTEMPEQMTDLTYIPVQEGVAYKTKCKNETDCLQAIRQILDGEATDEQLAHFKENMNKCLPCIENHNLEVAIRKVICDKIHKKPVPPGLAEKIRQQIK